MSLLEGSVINRPSNENITERESIIWSTYPVDNVRYLGQVGQFSILAEEKICQRILDISAIHGPPDQEFRHLAEKTGTVPY